MTLQETEFNILIDDINSSENIYDVLVSLYMIIDNENYPRYVGVYAERLENDENLFEVFNLKIEELVFGDIKIDSFKASILKLLTRENVRLHAFYILFKFDSILEEIDKYPLFNMKKKISLNVLVKVSALNSNNKRYRFYLMTNESLSNKSEAIEKSEMRCMDRASGYSIFCRIKSYKILPAAMPEVNIYRYCDDYFNSKFLSPDSLIKVAVIPVAKEVWYHVIYTKNSKSNINFFEISDSEEKIDEINQSYIKLLRKLNENKIEIVVFPELAMNAKTEKTIADYLIEATLMNPKDHSIKLVFCGSMWKDQENCCTLLSGSGSVLLRNLKRNPFELVKEKTVYLERLKIISSVYNIIDIAGLGRIWYLVCKDGLDDMPQTQMQHEYGVTFEMISCYSKSISYFESEAKSFSEKYKGITVLANCCEPRINRKGAKTGEDIGFICTPVMRKSQPFIAAGNMEYYKISKECDSCMEYCSCARVFTIYPGEFADGESTSGMKVCCENFHLSY